MIPRRRTETVTHPSILRRDAHSLVWHNIFEQSDWPTRILVMLSQQDQEMWRNVPDPSFAGGSHFCGSGAGNETRVQLAGLMYGSARGRQMLQYKINPNPNPNTNPSSPYCIMRFIFGSRVHVPLCGLPNELCSIGMLLFIGYVLLYITISCIISLWDTSLMTTLSAVRTTELC